MRLARDLLLMTAALAAATWLAGWWAVPLLAAATALWSRMPARRVPQLMLGAAAAWAVLLALQGVFGASVPALARDVALSLGVPASVPLVLTVLLPALLAGSAAGSVAAVKRPRAPEQSAP